jgi:hypothetical protein
MKDVFSRLSQVGLKEITTERQKKNGTRSFVDKRFAKVRYTWSASGYVRRIREHSLSHMYAPRSYQLNPCINVPHLNGYTSKERIMVTDPTFACLIIMQHAVQYRDRPQNRP